MQMRPSPQEGSKSNAIDLSLHLPLSCSCLCFISMRLNRGERFRFGYRGGLKVELYLKDRASVECPLTYWREKTVKLRRPAALARKYLAIPASSGPIEKSFSTAGKIFTPQKQKFLTCILLL